MPGDRSEQLQRRIAAIQSWFSGDLSLAAKNLTTGEEVFVAADQLHPTASVFKIPVMIEVFRQAEAGNFSLEDRIEFQADDVVRGSGVLRDLMPGLKPTIHDLIVLMIIVSDNTATNMLIDLVGGVESINQTLLAHELQATKVHRKIDFSTLEKDNRAVAEATPMELLRLIEGLAKGRIVSPQASTRMLTILGRQHYLNQVPRFFKHNPYGPELNEPQPLWIGSKTGSLPGMRADAGLILLPSEIEVAYCVMNANSKDTGFTHDNESEVANGLAGYILLAHWWPEDSDIPLPVASSPHIDAVFGDGT
jgi:beta-lactamase class A